VATEFKRRCEIPLDIAEALTKAPSDFLDEKIMLAETRRRPVAVTPHGETVEYLLGPGHRPS
jgi:hypothetical protein